MSGIFLTAAADGAVDGATDVAVGTVLADGDAVPGALVAPGEQAVSARHNRHAPST